MSTSRTTHWKAPAEAASCLLGERGEAWRAVREDLDRVELLGTHRIDSAVRAMENAFVGMRDVNTAQGQVGATCPHWDEWIPR